MDIPTPEEKTPEEEKAEYVNDLHLLSKAQSYIKRMFGEDEAIDFMITECKHYVQNGEFSKHTYDYANKELPQLTEEEVAKALPKNWQGKPIWSYKDV